MHLNYTLSLPNKLFDYIHAGVPVLVSPLVELQRIVSEYQVGVVVDEVHPKVIAEAIERAIASEDYPVWVSNCAQAARVLNWESDFQKIRVALSTL
jgi:glycosyltransferase involved in cell wall biosynthesis